MSKFNKKTEVEKVTNYMGEEAFVVPDKLGLIGLLLTSFVQGSYYEKESDTLKRFEEYVKNIKDKEFVAKAGIFARKEFNMRSITHVLSSLIAKYVKGEDWTKDYFKNVVERVDDITEILSCYFNSYGKPLPNSMRKGLKAAFDKFDEYQLAKYRAEGKDISLIDAVNLLHPKGNQKNTGALKKLIEGTLKSKTTWNAKLTSAGQTAKNEEEKQELKKEVWVDFVNNPKLEYFALLRNLRNIVEQAPEAVDKACSELSNIKRIQKSKVLPFRFLSAYQAIEEMRSKAPKKKVVFESEKVNNTDNISKIKAALNNALELSIDNIPLLTGKVAILSDNSGSMTGDGGGSSLVSVMSKTKTSDIANLFAVMYWKKAADTFVGLFGDKLITPNLKRDKDLFENFKIIDAEKNRCGGATEAGIFHFFRDIIKNKTRVDRIVVFSDCQIGEGNQWYGLHGSDPSGSFNKLYLEYKKINPSIKVYSIDLKNYGTNVFSGDVYRLCGWSEKIFEIMSILEQDKNALIKRIEEIKL